MSPAPSTFEPREAEGSEGLVQRDRPPLVAGMEWLEAGIALLAVGVALSPS
jgi:hypothetical protein